ncbi:MAG TPA: M50 family metallopeptidase [Thermoanaerobaculia bacterium]|jgi:Zn-dependent protease|nr:M50 family metallopeptidase [Thermoanaerobaculia bacterium]
MGRIHLGTIFGTTITLDLSFLILIVFFVMMSMQSSGMPYALLWAPILFIGVLFHEFAHASMIAALGFGSSAIILQGMGGATYNERRARPWQDLLISAAGPASNFLLAWIIGLIIAGVPAATRDPFFRSLLPLLAYANMFWGVLNLLPIGPLDGNNIVRNFFRLFLRERPAFVVSIWISILVGVAVIVYCLLTRDFFIAILVAWYVWTSWTQWQFFRSHNRTD